MALVEGWVETTSLLAAPGRTISVWVATASGREVLVIVASPANVTLKR